MVGHPAGDRVVAGHQLLAPALGLVQGQGLGGAAQLEGGHGLAHRSGSIWRISLPMNCSWRRRPSCERVRWYFLQRVAQLFGQVQLAAARDRQLGQGQAQGLQLVHLALERGLAGPAIGVEGVGGGGTGRSSAHGGSGIGGDRGSL
jgi:hypothetical protein